MLFNIFLTAFFVALNGFFVAAEFAIVKIRSSQLDILIRSGSKAAKIARHLTEHLNEYLSATQLGVTIASLALGWIGEPIVSKIIASIVSFIGLIPDEKLIEKISLPTAFITITILHIVFGELAPKSIAIFKTEKTTITVAIPLRIFYFIFKPIIGFLNGFANLLLKIIGITTTSGHYEFHTEEELRQILEESSKAGRILETEEEMIQNIFDFTDRLVKQVMVPRNRIVGVEKSEPYDSIISKFIDEGYSRIPVYETTIDNVIGILYAKDLLKILKSTNEEISKTNFLDKLIRKPLFVKENEKINDVFPIMQKNKIHMAIVVDEFGGTAGLITIEDILEEIVGEIQDEYDEEPPPVVKINENEYEILASTSIDDINDVLPQPLPKSDEYETLSGLLFHHLGKIPNEGETVFFDNFDIVVCKSTERAIEKVRVIFKPLQAEEEN